MATRRARDGKRLTTLGAFMLIKLMTLRILLWWWCAFLRNPHRRERAAQNQAHALVAHFSVRQSPAPRILAADTIVLAIAGLLLLVLPLSNGGAGGDGRSEGAPQEGGCGNGVSACDAQGKCECLPPPKARAKRSSSSLGWFVPSLITVCRHCISATNLWCLYARVHTRMQGARQTDGHRRGSESARGGTCTRPAGSESPLLKPARYTLKTRWEPKIGMSVMQGRRLKQEDAVVARLLRACPPPTPDACVNFSHSLAPEACKACKDVLFAGLFDGHGSSWVSETAAARVHRLVQAH